MHFCCFKVVSYKAPLKQYTENTNTMLADFAVARINCHALDKIVCTMKRKDCCSLYSLQMKIHSIQFIATERVLQH